MHTIKLSTIELKMIVQAFHSLTIKGIEARQVGLLLDKIETELEKSELRSEKSQKPQSE